MIVPSNKSCSLSYYKHLNRQNADIQFSKEIEENGKIPGLDCLVIGDNSRPRKTIYRKPTHTYRLLDQSSYNPTSHKPTTIRALTRRAQLVCDSPDSLQDETENLNNVFSENNYNTDFVRRNTHREQYTRSNAATARPLTLVNLSTRLTERKRATRNGDVNNHIPKHHLKTKHQSTGTPPHVLRIIQTTKKVGLLT